MTTSHDTGPAAEPTFPDDEERRRLVRVTSVHLDDNELPHRVELRFQASQLSALLDALTPELARYTESGNQQDPRRRALRVTSSKAQQALTAARLRVEACGTTAAQWLPIDLGVVDAAHLAEFAGEQAKQHPQLIVLDAVHRALSDAVFNAYWLSLPWHGGLYSFLIRVRDTERTADTSVPGDEDANQEDLTR